MISIVIPTYNERENLERLVEGIDKNVKNYEIIIVDDNSPDKTWEKALELSKLYNLKVIRRKSKLGLGSAVIEGFRHAKGEIIGVMDADLSHDPRYIPRLIRQIVNGADIVIGSRLVRGGGVEVWPWHRKFISKIASLIARVLTNVKDPMSGFFFFRRNIIKGLKLCTKGYKIGLEIIVRGKYNEIIEVPYMFRNRAVGKSKLNLKEYILYLIDIIRLIKNRYFIKD